MKAYYLLLENRRESNIFSTYSIINQNVYLNKLRRSIEYYRLEVTTSGVRSTDRSFTVDTYALLQGHFVSS